MAVVYKQLTALGFVDLSQGHKQKRFIQLCEATDSFYQSAERKLNDDREKTSSVEPIAILLGVFGHQLEKSLQGLREQRAAMVAMQQAISDNLSPAHADKFTNQSALDLELNASIFLFLQGRRGLDFSLANDFALEASSELAQVTDVEVDAHRVQLNKFYYLGDEALKASRMASPIWRWFEKWFN
jgi:hypothetical protein